MTNFLEKLKDRSAAVKAAVLATKDELTSIVVDEQIRLDRMSICTSCEHLFEPLMQCKKCGCFVKAKTSIAMFKCPIDKWIAIKVEK